MRISDWSSDVCSSDLDQRGRGGGGFGGGGGGLLFSLLPLIGSRFGCGGIAVVLILFAVFGGLGNLGNLGGMLGGGGSAPTTRIAAPGSGRSEERRVGKECVSQCRSRWSPTPEKNTKINTKINRVRVSITNV